MSFTWKEPKLRFPEFSGEWVEKKLIELGEFKNGLNKSKEDFGHGFPFVNLMDVFGKDIVKNEKFDLVNANEKDLQLYNLKQGDVLFIRSSVKREGVGETVLVLNDLLHTTYSGFLIRFREKRDNLELFYKKYCFKTETFRNSLLALSTTSANTNINQESLNTLKINIPSKPEQEKIASFLTAVDVKIEQLTCKEKLLEKYKKSVLQKLFSQELRFKADDGSEFPEWEEKRLGEIATRKTVKNKECNTNVLTISAQYGLISQLEFFNKSVSAKDITGYYLLEKGDFAYNKSYSNGYPMGAIKSLNRYDKGVVSTLYICFYFNENINLSFMEQYFEMGMQNEEIEKVAQEGARNHGLLNIGLENFFSITIHLPSLPEQTKIANFLSAIDKKLLHVKAQLEQTQQFKKALLQQMFV
jgi:type I restriction enzyme, S subunit